MHPMYKVAVKLVHSSMAVQSNQVSVKRIAIVWLRTTMYAGKQQMHSFSKCAHHCCFNQPVYQRSMS